MKKLYNSTTKTINTSFLKWDKRLIDISPKDRNEQQTHERTDAQISQLSGKFKLKPNDNYSCPLDEIKNRV